jgi:hypothetical protein
MFTLDIIKKNWERHGTCPISSVVGLKSKVAITHYCENLQNLIDY